MSTPFLTVVLWQNLLVIDSRKFGNCKGNLWIFTNVKGLDGKNKTKFSKIIHNESIAIAKKNLKMQLHYFLTGFGQPLYAYNFSNFSHKLIDSIIMVMV